MIIFNITKVEKYVGFIFKLHCGAIILNTILILWFVLGYVENIHKPENEVFVCHEAEQPDFPTMMFAGDYN